MAKIVITTKELERSAEHWQRERDQTGNPFNLHLVARMPRYRSFAGWEREQQTAATAAA